MAKAPYSALSSIVKAGNDNDLVNVGVLKEVIAAIPIVVADAAARNALYSNPVGDEQVYNKATSQVERYDATYGTWVGALVIQTLVDDFERADGAFAGSDSSSGHTWGVTGTGTFAIASGRLTVNTVGAGYAQMELDSTPLEIGGVASWVTSAGSTASAATLICGDSQLLVGTPATWNAVHFTFSNVSWLLQIVVAGTFTTLATGTLSGLIDGGPKTVWMRIVGNTATFLAPDGIPRSVTDSRIGTLANKWIIYELQSNATGPLVRWDSVYAIEDFPAPSLVSKMLGATLRNRSTVKAFKILLDRGVAFSDTLTDFYIPSVNTTKTDGVFNAALGFVSGTNFTAAGNSKAGKASDTYSASITPNYGLGEWHLVTATNNTAFTYNAPTSPPSSAQTGNITVEILNSSGGVMGVITWDAIFKFAGKVWTNPANTFKRAATFRWSGTAWICIDISAADY